MCFGRLRFNETSYITLNLRKENSNNREDRFGSVSLGSTVGKGLGDHFIVTALVYANLLSAGTINFMLF